MRAKVVQINWHDQQPIFSVDFDPICLHRFATCGGDSTVRIWKIVQGESEYLTSLTRHTNGVNCVRFAPNSSILASGGDDGSIIIWKQTEEDEPAQMVVDDDSKEHWKLLAFLRGSNQEIYDLCWSPDGKLLAAGGVDGSVRIFDAENEHKVLHVVAEHSRFVQGIAWDPLFEFIATQSNDRSVNIFNYTKDSVKTPPKLFAKHIKMLVEEKSIRLYHDEDINSFFRRLAFSPDGSFLVTVAGITPGSNLDNTAYIYARGGIRGSPFAHLPGHKKPIVAIRFSPIKYHLSNNENQGANLTNLNYRYVFAVATLDAVVIYDTQSTKPIAFLGNLHYSFLSDISWSADGLSLIMSSQDGFCTFVEFEDGELGQAIEKVCFKLTQAPIKVQISSSFQTQIEAKPIQVLDGSFIKKKPQVMANALEVNVMKKV